MMWVLFRVPAVYTHITLLLLCVTNDDVGVVSSTRSLHPHHFVVVVCHSNDEVGVVSSTHSLHPHHFNNTFC